MEKIINACLDGRENNYILPFLWLHGEEEAVLRSYMAAIHSANIRAVCVESRPHPDFLGPKWWADLDVILDEARKRDMKVWILDDKHYPTGAAAGAMESAPAELHKQFLACNTTDIFGPQRRVRLDLGKLGNTPRNPFNPQPPKFQDDRLLAVVAARLDGAIDRSLNHASEVILLTQAQEGDFFTWDVPAGMWRVFAFYITRNGGDGRINLVDSASCKVLLDTVYEPHYARYAADFGKTIAGFFSDEPGLGNPATPSQGCIVGQTRMPLPWSRELEGTLEALWGRDYVCKLPALWGELGTREDTAAIREGYMNAVTCLVQSCFSQQLGSWCRERGVEYIGHIIEDNNASEGLGASTGHFFRSLWGQDMAGIDDIGSQITVGGANTEHASMVGSGDGEFYHHVLGKLGASLAHIDPKKKDRCMCECFGAYGWSEGTQTMKYILDHLLADGVNRFVPHAFSAKAFPDFDCPPHFYAGGEDVLFPAFGRLMAYLNRTSHVLSESRHSAPAAILYHAEAAWSGSPWMKMQKCARVLRERQIDFDILPAECLRLEQGRLLVNGRSYEALVIPGCEYLTDAALRFCREAEAANFPVYFGDFKPENAPGKVVPLQALPALLADTAHVKLTPAHGAIRIYHGIHGNSHVYFLFNSSPWEGFAGEVRVYSSGNCYRYDPMENRLYRRDLADSRIQVSLPPMESALFVVTEAQLPWEAEPPAPQHAVALDGKWQVCLEENGVFVPWEGENPLDGIRKDGWSGTVRYTYTAPAGLVPEKTGCVALHLPQVREVATVWCNGSPVGQAIAPPFRFDLTPFWSAGENRLQIDVTTTMEEKVKAASGGRDWFVFLQKAWFGYGLTDTPVIEYSSR